MVSVTVKAPGRVNIIGEHLDYSGFGVLPFPIQNCITITATLTDDVGVLKFINSDSKFQTIEIQSEGKDLFDLIQKIWSDYCIAVLIDFHKLYDCYEWPLSKSGVTFNIHSDLTSAAGMSSSSALTVGCALALGTLWMLSFPNSTPEALSRMMPSAALPSNYSTSARTYLADFCAHAERNIGVMGGGMDQAAILLGEEGSALHVQFEPSLSACAVPLPANFALVVVDSAVTSRKAHGAYARFNRRASECQLGAQLLKESLQLKLKLENNLDLQSHLPCNNTPATSHTLLRAAMSAGDCRLNVEQLNKALKWAEELVPDLLSSGDAVETMKRRLGNEGFAAFVKRVTIDPLTRDVGVGLKPLKRLQHVLSECKRVEEFVAELKKINNDASDVSTSWEILGSLMQGSHSSMQVDFEASCDEVDDLQKKLMSVDGVVGARVMGAGWGGCVVAICKGYELADKVTKIAKDDWGYETAFVAVPGHPARVAEFHV